MNETVMNIPVREGFCSSGQASNAKPELQLIYERHYQSLYKNVLHIIKCEQTAEDIVHDVFINFCVKNERIGEINDIHAYLCLMVRNCAIDYIRRKKLERRVLTEVSYRHPKQLINDQYVVKELHRTYHEAVSLLPSQQKIIYQLNRECKWGRGKIAQHLKISPNTVKASMQTALRKIKGHVIHKYQTEVLMK